MKTIQFKVKLLSDVVLSQKAATEGSQESLSFIPGNNFLGIMARLYDNFAPSCQVEIFHSGHVRFSDAHPVQTGGKHRSLHIPAALYYPKLSNIANSCFVSHFYDRNTDMRENGTPAQLKQCREGFYCFDGKDVLEVPVRKSFSLKSAYDRKLRRSSDSQMFGYESLEKDMEFLFSVEVDDDALAPVITRALTGTQHIGRSRTAQYGLVEISEFAFSEQESAPHAFTLAGKDYITVYADGRLIFLDTDGEPTLRPSARMLGLDGEIDWEMSQTRTFQYAPWNGKRQTRDTDRIGFEKGSVFVVLLLGEKPSGKLSAYIGNYQNEGFGKVIYGWDLLQQAGHNGLVSLHIASSRKKTDFKAVPLSGTPLLNFLAKKQKDEAASSYIYKQVNEFVNENKGLFAKASFASQWGTIRTIALQNETKDKILYELFDKKVTRKRVPTPTDRRSEETKPAGYITHGVKSKDWGAKNRADILKDFICKMGAAGEYGDLAQKALVNLTSEMAKIKQ